MSFIYRLPEEIRQQIIPYTYNIQNHKLLDDIRNFFRTRYTLLEIYYQRWITELGEEETEDKWWVINDITRFANKNKSTMYGYIDSFYNIFMRIYQLHTKEQIQIYITTMQSKSINSQINIFWGIMTPDERLQMLSEYG